MTFKKKIKSHYQNLLSEKINELRFMISDLAQDAQNDAKGSAGDKHETALSMMHLEQEKLNQKLAEIIAQKNVVDKIDADAIHTKVALGSLVHTNEMLFYVSTALPKIQLENKMIIAVSPQSPLGSQLLGKSVGDVIAINTNRFQIKTIQ
ncbi:transcription elongation GreA/GreB family factor [Flavobacterium aquaticum]|uniref:Transcription elongation GreA/GreB family factor n=1 Tax=Flavobacterium aquaticum TaxID=1236486 RepID=A0A327YPK7_9FLAO|nr:GreA/GreB family elongation factor [Flavobacterium aquaticum]RAK22492.1 transcription elongation GreA/GreB family factor [Flavobacterium aquaticum]